MKPKWETLIVRMKVWLAGWETEACLSALNSSGQVTRGSPLGPPEPSFSWPLPCSASPVPLPGALFLPMHQNPAHTSGPRPHACPSQWLLLALGGIHLSTFWALFSHS